MKTFSAALVSALILSTSAQADGDRHGGCSLRDLAGKWLFATDVGSLEGTGITAMGTMNIRRSGSLDGRFDVTIAGDEETGAFFPDVGYSGTVTVDRDCTGTLSFVTDFGDSRTDSVLVLNRNEMKGQSQDPTILWTYRVWRIDSRRHDD